MRNEVFSELPATRKPVYVLAPGHQDTKARAAREFSQLCGFVAPCESQTRTARAQAPPCELHSKRCMVRTPQCSASAQEDRLSRSRWRLFS